MPLDTRILDISIDIYSHYLTLKSLLIETKYDIHLLSPNSKIYQY